jgi:pentatricopeptide repeat protein
MGLGDLHQKERRVDEALLCWERLLELDPRLINIRTMAGNLCRKRLDFERAAFHFRAALRLEPHNAHAVFGLADALRGMGRFEEAAPLWDEILDLDPGNRQVLTRAGDCFCRLGQFEKAETLYRSVLDQGYDRSAQFGLARVQVRRGAFAEAVQRYEAVLERNPEDPRAILLKGQVLSEWRGPAEARAYLEAQQASHPGMHEIARALSRLRGADALGPQAGSALF